MGCKEKKTFIAEKEQGLEVKKNPTTTTTATPSRLVIILDPQVADDNAIADTAFRV